MAANQALNPSSKRALEDWVKTEVALPGVECFEVHQRYRAMDFLIESDEEIQREVYETLAELLNLEVDPLFFDTASSYFEMDDGPEEGSIKQRGYSKDHGPNLPQGVSGFAVTRDGIPVRRWSGRETLVKRPECELSRLKELDSDSHTKAHCALQSHRTSKRFLESDKLGNLKIEKEAVKATERLDGKHLIGTSDDTLSTEDVALGYKKLWQVKATSRTAVLADTTARPGRRKPHWTHLKRTSPDHERDALNHFEDRQQHSSSVY